MPVFNTRTSTPVVFSELPEYVFYDAILDEDLYFGECTIDVSQEAQGIAKDLISGVIDLPCNLSINLKVQQAYKDVLDGNFDLHNLKCLGIDLHQIEFDEAILLALCAITY